MALWHVVIKDSEISSYMKLAGLAWPKHQGIISAHYNFDQLFGTVLTDSSGKGNNGTLIGGPKWIEVSSIFYRTGFLLQVIHHVSSGAIYNLILLIVSIQYYANIYILMERKRNI